MWGTSARRVAGLVLAGVLIMPAGPVPTASAAPAPPATPATPGADAISPTVSLGQYALNGTVRAALVDDATGTTYLGGDFTRIGRRTGGVAVVDPPGTGDGALRTGSPEVLGTVEEVFADDRPGDPGFLLVGRIAAVNGTAVSQSQPVHRIHLVDGAWIRDASWSVSGECNVGNIKFPLDMPWIATDKYLVGGSLAGKDSWMGSRTGIVLIDRATGKLWSLGDSHCSADVLLPSIPNLSTLSACGGKARCEAYVGRLAWDAVAKRLLVSYWSVAGGNVDYQTGQSIAAYDLAPATGGRAWVRSLQAQPLVDSFGGSTSWAAALPGAFLLSGFFPLEGPTSEPEVSRLLVVDAATGAIRQRWSSVAEQDPATGAASGPVTPCTKGDMSSSASSARVGDDLYAWVGWDAILCRYGVAGGALTSARVGNASVQLAGDRREPIVPYQAPGGATYLVGSHAAVDAATGAPIAWDPDPAMNAAAVNPSVAVAGGVVVVGGDFRFVRGVSMPAIAALDADLAPLAGFGSPFGEPAAREGVRSLAFSKGRLVAGGLGGSQAILAALDLATGAVTWQPSDGALAAVDDLAVEPDGDVWAAGLATGGAPAAALRHYASPVDGGAPMAAPSLGCLDAPGINGGPSVPTCTPSWEGRTRVGAVMVDADGRVVFAGAFGTVDGQARRGLARLETDGTLSAWSPDLLGALPIPADGGLDAIEPMSMAVLADNLVLGGRFTWIIPNPAGAFWMIEASPLLVFSTSSGALVRPTDPERSRWFDVGGWWPVGADMLPTDGGLAVALGEPGMGIFDATTLELDTASSAPYLDPNWLTPIDGYGVYALATRLPSGAAPAASPASTDRTDAQGDLLAEAPAPLVIGGAIPRWKYRVAGNVIRTTVAPDTTPPTVSSVRAAPRSGTVAGSTATSVRVSWTAADPKGSGAASYDIARSTGGGAWQTVASARKLRYLDAVLRPGTSYRFRVRARDNAGNLGSWMAGPTITTALVQQTSAAVRFSSGWDLVRATAYSGGSARKRGAAGASATYSFTGRGVGFVTTLAPNRGRVKVYVDGRYDRTLDLRSATYRYRTVAWGRSWTASGKHTVRLVVSGTSGRPRIDVDAFVVVR